MAVRVRMFAALREAAGEAETALPPGPLPVLLEALRARYGGRFEAQLAACGVLIDGDAVPRGSNTVVPDGAELALLPPVSGGAADHPPPRRQPTGRQRRAAPRRQPTGRQRRAALRRQQAEGTRAASSRASSARRSSAGRRLGLAALLALSGAALTVGPIPFAVVVAVLAAVALIDTTELLDRAGARPVLLVAAGPAVGLPLAVAFRPEAGLRLVPTVMAAMTLAAFCLVLAFRRGGASGALGATAVASLLIGVGASGLVLLSGTPDGPRWVLGLFALVAVADVTSLILRRWAVVPSVWLEVAIPFVLTAAASLCWPLLAPPFSRSTAGQFTGIALVATVCATRMEYSLGFEAGVRLDSGAAQLGQGRVLAALDGLLLAAPAAYLLVHLEAF